MKKIVSVKHLQKLGPNPMETIFFFKHAMRKRSKTPSIPAVPDSSSGGACDPHGRPQIPLADDWLTNDSRRHFFFQPKTANASDHFRRTNFDDGWYCFFSNSFQLLITFKDGEWSLWIDFGPKKKSKPCPRSGPPSWKFENEIRRRPFEQTTPSTRRREQLKFAFFLRVFAQPYRHWRLVFLSFFSRYFKATSRRFIRRSQREQHPRPVGENRSGTDASSWTLTGRAHTWKPMRRRRKMAALIAGSVFTLRPTRQSTDEAFTFLFSTQKKSLRQSNQAPHHHVTLAILH